MFLFVFFGCFLRNSRHFFRKFKAKIVFFFFFCLGCVLGFLEILQGFPGCFLGCFLIFLTDFSGNSRNYCFFAVVLVGGFLLFVSSLGFLRGVLGSIFSNLF